MVTEIVDSVRDISAKGIRKMAVCGVVERSLFELAVFEKAGTEQARNKTFDDSLTHRWQTLTTDMILRGLPALGPTGTV